MFRSLTVILICLMTVPFSASGAELTRLGYGRLINNDLLGDLRDRERTGSFSSSRVWGREWDGNLPHAAGAIVELRFGLEVLAPDRLNNPRLGSRPWAGALSVGVHTHFERDSIEFAMGASIYATGPQTQLGELQQEFHQLIGAPAPSDRTLAGQIGNGFYPTVLIEAGRRFDFGAMTSLRPFVEAQVGIEDLVRAGFDLTIGGVGQQELLVRDTTTGHRYRVIKNDDVTGFSWVVGADIAHVSSSTYLPRDRGYVLTNQRKRLRMGVHWQSERLSAFYGLTWLGKEYSTQPDDQIVGSVRINYAF